MLCEPSEALCTVQGAINGSSTRLSSLIGDLTGLETDLIPENQNNRVPWPNIWCEPSKALHNVLLCGPVARASLVIRQHPKVCVRLKSALEQKHHAMGATDAAIRQSWFLCSSSSIVEIWRYYDNWAVGPWR